MSEIEERRLQDLQDARESYEGSDLNARFGPGSFGHHEMTDRAYVASEMWDFTARSPATIIDPELYELAVKIHDLMWDFYQKASLKSWEAEEKQYPEEGHHERDVNGK